MSMRMRTHRHISSFLLFTRGLKRKFPRRNDMHCISLRWHYPHQVQGSMVLPSSQPVTQAPRGVHHTARGIKGGI